MPDYSKIVPVPAIRKQLTAEALSIAKNRCPTKQTKD
jgi:hypothetical protein